MKKLLAIVDDWERLERYEEQLSSAFEFHPSPFGRHGIELALQEQPDLILIDLEFEDMNEVEAWMLIRAESSLKKTPIIMITSSDEVDRQALANTTVLFRPISPASVLDKINEIKF